LYLCPSLEITSQGNGSPERGKDSLIQCRQRRAHCPRQYERACFASLFGLWQESRTRTLRKMTFPERADAEGPGPLSEEPDSSGAIFTKSAIYGATRGDSWIDLKGGIAIYSLTASLRRNFPTNLSAWMAKASAWARPVLLWGSTFSFPKKASPFISMPLISRLGHAGKNSRQPAVRGYPPS